MTSLPCHFISRLTESISQKTRRFLPMDHALLNTGSPQPLTQKHVDKFQEGNLGLIKAYLFLNAGYHCFGHLKGQGSDSLRFHRP